MISTKEEDALQDVPESDLSSLWNDQTKIESMMLTLMESIRWIDSQLGDRNRSHPDGTRFTDQEYWDWRHRAIGAKNHKTSLYRRLKLRVKELNQGQHDAELADAAERHAKALADNPTRLHQERVEALLTRIVELLERQTGILR